jgi:hypothetical protein
MLLLTLQHQRQIMRRYSCRMLLPQQRQPASQLQTMLLRPLQMLCMKDSARQVRQQMLWATQPQAVRTESAML